MPGVREENALAVDPSAMSLVIDKLGVDADTVVSRDGKVRVYARLVPSFDFYGWLFQASDVVELEAPKRVVRAYRERLEAAPGRFEYNDTGRKPSESRKNYVDEH